MELSVTAGPNAQSNKEAHLWTSPTGQQAPKELQEYLATHQDDLLTHIVQFNELMRQYQAATKEITTKLEIYRETLSTAAAPA